MNIAAPAWMHVFLNVEKKAVYVTELSGVIYK